MTRRTLAGLRELLARSPGLQYLLLFLGIIAFLLLAEYTGLVPG